MVALATALHQGLVSASMARLTETDKQGKMEELYQYLLSIEFRQHVEGMVESFVALERDLAKERVPWTRCGRRGRNKLAVHCATRR